ncbi:hypothetical protein [Brevundimonas sp.]|uniref:hypothetical protein n=1 Tax=Brevundimonas sp. TaxID=1871086 RepID=UPI001D798B49|nr:hypothetical protein [Brevundimonas sp.]MBL0948787.1 hypothetical protein [Brevundimonas sp.]
MIGAVTMGAAIAAAVFAKNAAEHTKSSADTAERALSTVERPYLAIEITKSGVVCKDRGTTFGKVHYIFKNLGRTPAILIRQHFTYRRSDGLPNHIDPIETVGTQLPYGITIASGGKSEKFKTGHALPITAMFEQRRMDEPRGDTLFLLGFVVYRDLAGNEFATGFCFAHDNESEFYLASPRHCGAEGDRYNYDRVIAQHDRSLHVLKG